MRKKRSCCCFCFFRNHFNFPVQFHSEISILEKYRTLSTIIKSYWFWYKNIDIVIIQPNIYYRNRHSGWYKQTGTTEMCNSIQEREPSQIVISGTFSWLRYKHILQNQLIFFSKLPLILCHPNCSVLASCKLHLIIQTIKFIDLQCTFPSSRLREGVARRTYRL